MAKEYRSLPRRLARAKLRGRRARAGARRKRLAERGAEKLAPRTSSSAARNRNVPRALCSKASLAALYLEHGFEPIGDAMVAAFDGGRITYAALTTHVDHKTGYRRTRPPGAAGRHGVLYVEKGAPRDHTFTARRDDRRRGKWASAPAARRRTPSRPRLAKRSTASLALRALSRQRC